VELPGTDSGWHVKLRPSGEHQSLSEEAERIIWAQKRIPTIEKARAIRLPGISALVTKTIEGLPSHKYIDTLQPERIIAGVDSAIALMQRADTDAFPFPAPAWTTEQGIAGNIRRLTDEKAKHRGLHPDFAARTKQELIDILEAGPGADEKVLTHGDLCMPNVLLGNTGDVTGIVDLGGLHIGNRKQDLAIMSWTVEANMGSRWSDQLLAANSTSFDNPGILYQRLIYDLGLKRPDPWAWTQSPQLIEQRERLSE
jgi:aminoglycoside phosphotransferase